MDYSPLIAFMYGFSAAAAVVACVWVVVDSWHLVLEALHAGGFDGD